MTLPHSSSVRVTVRTKILAALRKGKTRTPRIVESLPPVRAIKMRTPKDVETHEVNPLKKIGK